MTQEITHKICSKCNKRYPLESFPFNPTTDRRDSECWECVWDRGKPKEMPKVVGKSTTPPLLGKMHNFKPNPNMDIEIKFKEPKKEPVEEYDKSVPTFIKNKEQKREIEEIEAKTVKICSKCKQEKPRAEFGVVKSSKDKRDYLCKICRKEVVRKAMKNDAEYLWSVVEKELQKNKTANAKTFKSLIPRNYHSRIYLLLDELIKQGKIKKTKIKNINIYSLSTMDEKIDKVKVPLKDDKLKQLQKNLDEINELATNKIEEDNITTITMVLKIGNKNNDWQEAINYKGDFLKIRKELMEIIEKYRNQ